MEERKVVGGRKAGARNPSASAGGGGVEKVSHGYAYQNMKG
jgi:hypothetical protein